MELERKSYKASLQSAGDAGVVTALVSCFGNVDRAKEMVMPGAFTQSLQKKLPKGVVSHDWTKPCAKALEAYETPEGLVIKAQFNLDTQAGAEAFSNIKGGYLDEWSIGYEVIKASYDKKAGVRHLDELRLYEFSPVLLGMNEATATLSTKNAANTMETPVMSASNAAEEIIRPNFGGNPKGQQWARDQKSYGQMFVESKEYQDFLHSHSSTSESGAVTFDVGLKAVMTTTTGWPVESVRSPLVVPFATRPLQVTDVIPVVTTTQNSFVYLETTGWTNTAVETAEGAAKPEATLALTEKQSPVRKIPVYIPVTDEQLEDVVGIQEWIEAQLSFMVRQRLESEVLVGDGLGVNILGILATPGIQTHAKGADPATDAIRKAMTKVRVGGRGIPSALIIHPNDWAEIQLLRTTDGIYLAGSPWDAAPERIWGLPVVQSDALPEGSAIVSDFVNYSLLVERKKLTVKVGYNADDWTRNRRTIIAEVRCTFVLTRPAATVHVTGL